MVRAYGANDCARAAHAGPHCLRSVSQNRIAAATGRPETALRVAVFFVVRVRYILVLF